MLTVCLSPLPPLPPLAGSAQAEVASRDTVRAAAPNHFSGVVRVMGGPFVRVGHTR